MPIIAVFLGIIIKIFHEDHPPPHVHVQYGEYEAVVEIKTGDIMKGKLPKRVRQIVRNWVKNKQFELRRAWQVAQENKIPKKIEGPEK